MTDPTPEPCAIQRAHPPHRRMLGRRAYQCPGREPTLECTTSCSEQHTYTDGCAAGCCPHCGRGDCAPTAAEYEQLRQRAEASEATPAAMREACDAMSAKSEALAREAAERHDDALLALATGYGEAASHIRAARPSQPEPGPACADNPACDGRCCKREEPRP